jgi:hypothetical protein
MNVTRPDRRIVTFYSFKGGVGRALLADVISEKAGPAVLEAWPAWTAA